MNGVEAFLILGLGVPIFVTGTVLFFISNKTRMLNNFFHWLVPSVVREWD